jgi:hypothetical protein
VVVRGGCDSFAGSVPVFGGPVTCFVFVVRFWCSIWVVLFQWRFVVLVVMFLLRRRDCCVGCMVVLVAADLATMWVLELGDRRLLLRRRFWFVATLMGVLVVICCSGDGSGGVVWLRGGFSAFVQVVCWPAFGYCEFCFEVVGGAWWLSVVVVCSV